MGKDAMRYEWNHMVEWGECDPARIVFYPNIYRWFDKSSHDLMQFHGFAQADMIEQMGIVGYPLIETHAEFITPMKWNDSLTISSHIKSRTRKTFTVSHRIVNADVLSVEGYEIRCWGMRDEQNGKMFAMQLPEKFVVAVDADN